MKPQYFLAIGSFLYLLSLFISVRSVFADMAEMTASPEPSAYTPPVPVSEVASRTVTPLLPSVEASPEPSVYETPAIPIADYKTPLPTLYATPLPTLEAATPTETPTAVPTAHASLFPGIETASPTETPTGTPTATSGDLEEDLFEKVLKSDSTTVLASAVINGDVIPAAERHRFTFVGQIKSDLGSGTGFLVGCNRAVLTAAHVVRDMVLTNTFFYPFGTDADADKIAIRDIRYITFDRRKDIEDLAVLFLDTAAPAVFRPAKLAIRSLEYSSMPGTIIGYGATAPNQQVNFQFPNIGIGKYVGPLSKYWGLPGAPLANTDEGLMIVMPGKSGQIGFYGDSGSPFVLTYDNQPNDEVIGVLNSGGTYGPAGNSLPYNAYVPIHPHREWLGTQIRGICGEQAPVFQADLLSGNREDSPEERDVAAYSLIVLAGTNNLGQATRTKTLTFCHLKGKRLPTLFESERLNNDLRWEIAGGGYGNFAGWFWMLGSREDPAWPYLRWSLEGNTGPDIAQRNFSGNMVCVR